MRSHSKHTVDIVKTWRGARGANRWQERLSLAAIRGHSARIALPIDREKLLADRNRRTRPPQVVTKNRSARRGSRERETIRKLIRTLNSEIWRRSGNQSPN